MAAHRAVPGSVNTLALCCAADASLFYAFVRATTGAHPPLNVMAYILELTQCVRPGLRELYDMLLAQKAAGRVSHIFMCTAASDCEGWVTFLRHTLETWYNAPIYDGVVDCLQLDAWNASHGVRRVGCMPVYKDMMLIRALANKGADARVFAVDDRPQYIRNGEALGVTPYFVAVNLLELVRLVAPSLYPAAAEKATCETLQASWNAFVMDPRTVTDVRADTALRTCTAALLEKLMHL